MTDTIIKGTGNSRLIKAPPNIASLAPDHKALLDLLASGLPVDLSGPVAAGCDVVGTPLNKVFFSQFGRVETGHYAGTGQWWDHYPTTDPDPATVAKNKLVFTSEPQALIVVSATSEREDSYNASTFFVRDWNEYISTGGYVNGIRRSVIWGSNYIEWAGANPASQLNMTKVNYHYIALLRG